MNRVVLRVNDQIATLHDYRTRYAERLAQIQSAEGDAGRMRERLDAAGENVMRELLEELLVLSRARQLGISPTAGEIEAAMDRARESFGLETEEQFVAALESSGMTPDDLREQMRRNLLIQSVMGREVQARIEVEDDELRRLYRENLDQFQVPAQVHLQGVVVLESAGLDATGQATVATEIRGRAGSGESLEEIVPEYAAEGTTTDLVDLGWVTAEDLDPALAAAVTDLAQGELSEPVAARGGMHVLQLLERRDPRTMEFEEVAARLEAAERDRRFRSELQEYLLELFDDAYIKADPPPEAVGFMGALETAADELLLQSVPGLGEAAPPIDPSPEDEGGGEGEGVGG